MIKKGSSVTQNLLSFYTYVVLKIQYSDNSPFSSYLMLYCLQDFHEECGTEAFRKFDRSSTGFISATDFEQLMLLVKSHLLTEDVKNNLLAVGFILLLPLFVFLLRGNCILAVFMMIWYRLLEEFRAAIELVFHILWHLHHS